MTFLRQLFRAHHPKYWRVRLNIFSTVFFESFINNFLSLYQLFIPTYLLLFLMLFLYFECFFKILLSHFDMKLRSFQILFLPCQFLLNLIMLANHFVCFIVFPCPLNLSGIEILTMLFFTYIFQCILVQLFYLGFLMETISDGL